MSRGGEDQLTAAEATCLWLTGHFDGCLQTLQKFEAHDSRGPKLNHNLGIVEFCTGAVDATKLKDQLSQISSESIPSDSAEPASARPRSSGDNLPLCTGPLEHAVCLVNKAILLYREQQYASAAEILEQLYANVEALYEGTAVRVLTLLLDIYIESRQLPKAVTLLHQFEKSYTNLLATYLGGKDAAGEAGGDASTSGAPDAAGAGAADGDSPTGTAAAANSTSTSSSRPRTLALPAVSRWTSGPMERSKTLLEQQGTPLPVPDLKLLIKLYRTRLHMLANNTRAAKRELKSVLSLSLEPPLPTALMMRAQLELRRGRAKKAAKLLVAMLQEPSLPQHQRPLLLNALGLVHQQQGKHQLALLCMTQAASAVQQPGHGSSSNGVSGASLERQQQGQHAVGLPTALATPAIMYNAGLQHLLLHNHAAALDCFRQAGALYFHQPLLWLRTGEAALGLHRQLCGAAGGEGAAADLAARGAAAATSFLQHSAPSLANSSPAELLQEAVAALQLALQQLEAQDEQYGQWRSNAQEEGSSLLLTSAPSLGSDLQMLTLAQQQQQLQQTSPTAAAAGGPEDGMRLANGSSDVHGHGTDPSVTLSEELAVTRRAVLANLAYAHLQAEDWANALQVASLLQALATGHTAYLATCYAAEALCHMDRAPEAVECLSMWLMQAQEGEAQQQPASALSCSSQRSDDDSSREVYPLGNAADLAALAGPVALASTYTHLAAVYANQGELGQAQALVRQALALQPGSSRALLLLVYCELYAGNVTGALRVLKGGAGAAQGLP